MSWMFFIWAPPLASSQASCFLSKQHPQGLHFALSAALGIISLLQISLSQEGRARPLSMARTCRNPALSWFIKFISYHFQWHRSSEFRVYFCFVLFTFIMLLISPRPSLSSTCAHTLDSALPLLKPQAHTNAWANTQDHTVIPDSNKPQIWFANRFLPGESQGQRSLMGYSPQGRKELDITEVI